MNLPKYGRKLPQSSTRATIRCDVHHYRKSWNCLAHFARSPN